MFLPVAALVILASVALGSHPTSTADAMDVLYGTADPNTTTVVESRYPRTALGLLAGLCLAVAGTLMQGVTRTPLADPGLLGITAGASAAIGFALDRTGLRDLTEAQAGRLSGGQPPASPPT
ncbi:iron chelate uptake ABC transporter family permease subunit [Streptosporangium canum]|uniref:iron chelate uptake ABC transporter family permease subunit n=1 Tax=Streptosporangium canum TaxID=324952 RepID=UPI003F4E1A1C